MAPESKGIQRVECMIDGTIELADNHGSFVYYDAHVEALERAEARAERIDARYVQCRAEMLEQSQRAEAAEEKLKGLREGLEALAGWRDAEASMLPGYEAAAQSPSAAAWHQGARAALERVEEKIQALLDTYSVDEGSGA